MKLLKKGISVLLVITLVVSLAACGQGDGDVSSQNASSNNTSSEGEGGIGGFFDKLFGNASSEPTGDDTAGEHRPAYQEETQKEKFVDKDGEFEYKTVNWDGPAGYVIVVPVGNSAARKTATALQDYYKKTASVTLPIVTDATSETAKEILIGKTKRSQSNKNLAEGELKVSVSGKKLVFDGGHNVTVDSAVQKFIRTAPAKNKANTFEVKTDFSTTVFLDGYTYVWGDEFEAEELDMTKWGFDATMMGTARAQVSYDRDVIDNGDGRLKLRGIRYFNPEREGTQYKMPYGVTTRQHMNYVYGYAEIRARLPFFRGIWPSFWTKSDSVPVANANGVYRNPHYYVEVDVFEIAGSEKGSGGSNLHRWFQGTTEPCSKCNIDEFKANGHSSGWSHQHVPFQLSDVETRNEQYHVYGWEWTKKEMKMYFDGELITTWDISKSYDFCGDVSGWSDPEYIIFNCHVTTTDTSNPVGFIEDSLDDLPAEYFIDYFRLYQKKSDRNSKIWVEDEYIGYERN